MGQRLNQFWKQVLSYCDDVAAGACNTAITLVACRCPFIDRFLSKPYVHSQLHLTRYAFLS